MLARLTATLAGLLAGAMLLIAVAVVPFWRSLRPAEFRAWFAAHSHRIGRLMIPLGASTAIVAIAAALVSHPTTRRSSIGAALAALGIVTITVLVNEPANQRFAANDALTDAETRVLLERWAVFHWIRVVLGIAGLWFAVRATGS